MLDLKPTNGICDAFANLANCGSSIADMRSLVEAAPPALVPA